jgi:hypothetical protein
MRSLTRPAAVLCFFLLALAPVAFFGHGGPGPDLDSYGRMIERARFPEKFTPRTFRLLADWFVDRIGLRNLLVAIGAELNLAILHISTNRNVLLGSDSWLFWTDNEKEPAIMMLDLRGSLRFGPTEISAINANLHNIADAFARCGKTVMITIIPNKQTIYREYLVHESASVPSRLDDLLEKVDTKARSIVLDARGPLLAAKRSEGLPLYFKTDTHWNELGAFQVYREIIRRLDRVGSVYTPQFASLNNYEVKEEHSAGGDLSTRMLLAPWLFSDVTVHLLPKQVLPFVSHVSSDEFNSVYQNERGRSHLVLVGDSFSPVLAGFLARHFKEVDQHRHLVPRFDGTLAAGADVEIFELVERNLSLLQLPAIGLDSVCRPR